MRTRKQQVCMDLQAYWNEVFYGIGVIAQEQNSKKMMIEILCGWKPKKQTTTG